METINSVIEFLTQYNRPDLVECVLNTHNRLEAYISGLHTQCAATIDSYSPSQQNYQKVKLNDFIDTVNRTMFGMHTYNVSNALAISFIYAASPKEKLEFSIRLFHALNSATTQATPLVVCSALDVEGKIILGLRHFDHYMCNVIDLMDIDPKILPVQGFVDSSGKFLTREEAYNVATENNQIKFRCDGDYKKLYSENIY